jgi:hypothetical protein
VVKFNFFLTSSILECSQVCSFSFFVLRQGPGWETPGSTLPEPLGGNAVRTFIIRPPQIPEFPSVDGFLKSGFSVAALVRAAPVCQGDVHALAFCWLHGLVILKLFER